jgi:hypothetical protein
MLFMFTMVSSVFSGIFASVSGICFKCFICLHAYSYVASVLDVSKVDRVLHLPPRLLLPRLDVSSSSSAALHPSQTAGDAMGASGGARALPFSVTQAGQGYRFVVLLLRVA